MELTDKPPTRAKGYPKIGICRDCGCEFTRRSGANILCPSCAELSKEASRARSQKRRNHSLLKAKEEERKAEKARRLTELERWKGLNHDCRYTKTCIYGGGTSCSYFAQTGELRTYDKETGERRHLIVNGKCDLYRRRRK